MWKSSPLLRGFRDRPRCGSPTPLDAALPARPQSGTNLDHPAADVATLLTRETERESVARFRWMHDGACRSGSRGCRNMKVTNIGQGLLVIGPLVVAIGQTF